jgi:hypothetical protein
MQGERWGSAPNPAKNLLKKVLGTPKLSKQTKHKDTYIS